ncbi:MAG TPA: DivIVA domain-containing protein [Acidimicrobiales bacterium]|nr:DivIVA domain-containing protein [Acidimicrobiales bacterium]
MPDPRPIPISSHPNLEPDAIAGRKFPVAWRGYDPESVHRFLVEVAQLVRQSRSRQHELIDRLSEAERRAAEPELDEATISAALGSETARILHVAHAAAGEVLSKAETRAAHIVAEAEAAGQELRRRADAEASAIVNEARGVASAAVDAAKEDCRAMIDEAREVRRRILSDLAERRRVFYSQIEQLRAGKDTLSSVVAHVAETIDAVRERLDGSEDDARAAAEVARRAIELETGPEDLGGQQAPQMEVSGAMDELAEPAVAEGATAFPDAATIDSVAPPETAGKSTGAPSDGELADQAAVTGDSAGAAVVDELFARIRQSTAAPGPPEDASAPARHGPRRARGAKGGKGAPAGEALPVAAGGDGPAPAGLRLGDVTVERSVLLRRRDELIERPLGELVHVLKRTLRVEQNELMHRLREAPRGTEPSTLSSLTDEAQRFAQASVVALSAVWREGASFARERLASTGRTASDASDEAACRAAAEEVATGLGAEIATSIADRLVRSFRGGDGEPESLQHAVGAAYHDWRGERIENTAGDFATRAFALGTLAVAQTERTPVSWIVDDGASRCSDCDDDELAGLLEPGASFPTGQPQPPAHAGCRCILVPAGM